MPHWRTIGRCAVVPSAAAVSVQCGSIAAAVVAAAASPTQHNGGGGGGGIPGAHMVVGIRSDVALQSGLRRDGSAVWLRRASLEDVGRAQESRGRRRRRRFALSALPKQWRAAVAYWAMQLWVLLVNLSFAESDFRRLLLTDYAREHPHELLLFVVALAASNVLYVITWRSDPGYISVGHHKTIPRLQQQQQQQQQIQSPPGSVAIDITTGDDEHSSEKKSLLAPLSSQEENEAGPSVHSPGRTTSLQAYATPHPHDNKDYCWHCDMTKAPRSKHCRHCDRCVAKLDHHCPHIGNCVGGKNHVFFWWYLLFQAFIMATALSSTISTFRFYSSWYHFILMYMVQLITFMICLIGFVGSFSLLVFHTWLLCSNMTTFEVLQRQRIQRRRALHRRDEDSSVPAMPPRYDEGVVRNVISFCFRRLRPEWTMTTRLVRHHSRFPEDVEMDSFDNQLPIDI